MIPEEIQSFCIAGTEAYLNFLEENDRGLDRILVVRKEQLGGQEKPTFKLTLAERLFDPESIKLEVRPPGQTYGPDDVTVVEYDGDAKVLIIQIKNPQLTLYVAAAENLYIVSNLRFLVKNVKQWFERNGAKLRLPKKNSNAPANSQMDEGYILLETCQKEAVSISFTNPMTYVWGPPGTGKTKHVLVNAVLKLFLAKKRVGIFAPTNNALEQALKSIIEAAECIGIERDKFIRVGHPSTKFAKEFPEVCEVQGLERRLAELRKQKEVYKDVLHYRRGATVLNSVATMQHETNILLQQLKDRHKIYKELAQLRRNPLSRIIHSFDGKLPASDNERIQLEKEINGQLELIKQIQTESPLLNEIITRIDYTNVEQTELEIIQLKDKTHQYMEEKKYLAASYDGQTNEEIQRLIKGLEQQIKIFEAQTILERIKTTQVIGMTLDCFIGRFHDTLLPLDHIFIDEAGYAPLVKALTLCRGKIPLTFLGDHMQLGPVCEMNDEDLGLMDNSAAIVWKKSALFVDELFLADDENALIAQLFGMNEPKLQRFTQVRLSKTFRFGQNLADILSRYVYNGINLVSADLEKNLKITCLNAVLNQKPDQKKQNLAEVKRIALYLQEHTELNIETEEAFAILTPYKNQVALLGERLVTARRQGRIMTVHKSQGREWDTVILSVVDGQFNRPWFTDTANPQSGGLFVMNTAISRARKHLVIVCDTEFWSRPEAEQQLISQLLNA